MGTKRFHKENFIAFIIMVFFSAIIYFVTYNISLTIASILVDILCYALNSTRIKKDVEEIEEIEAWKKDKAEGVNHFAKKKTEQK